jgi:hypothetical protein
MAIDLLIDGIVQVSTVLASLITIFAFIGIIFKFVIEIEKFKLAIWNIFYKPKYVISPTAEDILRYSIPAYGLEYKNNEEYNEEIQGCINITKYKIIKTQLIRLNIIKFSMALITVIIIVRMAQLGIQN